MPQVTLKRAQAEDLCDLLDNFTTTINWPAGLDLPSDPEDAKKCIFSVREELRSALSSQWDEYVLERDEHVISRIWCVLYNLGAYPARTWPAGLRTPPHVLSAHDTMDVVEELFRQALVLT